MLFKFLSSRFIIKFGCRSKSFYVTTPIFYVNADPHIGHLYTASLADVSARWQRINQPNSTKIKFSTGTDEHGQKVFEAANLRKKLPMDLCTKNSKRFAELFRLGEIEYTDFIRTTDEKHKKTVTYVWNQLVEKGFIYKGKYEGWYSKGDECFVPEINTEVISNDKNGVTKRIFTQSGHEVVWTSESNYMFKLTEVADKVMEWLKSDNCPIYPKLYMSYMDQMFENIEDLSISRESLRLPWGIPVPNDPSQTIYVWLDALINYLTVVGYPEQHMEFWPPNVQLLGLDILKFHAYYWPAFLIALDLPLPQRLIVHSHWLLNNQKMSKSTGNVVDPFALCDKYSGEAVRYFLMRQEVLETNSNFSEKVLKDYVNNDLANTLGNGLHRSTVPHINPSQKYPAFHSEDLDYLVSPSNAKDLINQVKNLCVTVEPYYENFQFYKVAREAFNCVRLANALLHENELWKKDNNNPFEKRLLNTALYCIYETLRVACIVAQPLIPRLSHKALDKLAIPFDERTINDAKDCFNHKYCGKNIDNSKKILFKRIK